MYSLVLSNSYNSVTQNDIKSNSSKGLLSSLLFFFSCSHEIGKQGKGDHCINFAQCTCSGNQEKRCNAGEQKWLWWYARRPQNNEWIVYMCLHTYVRTYVRFCIKIYSSRKLAVLTCLAALSPQFFFIFS